MSLLSKLFGGGGGGKSKAPDPVQHEGFTIFPEPMTEGSEHRLAARVEKEINGEVKTHQLIRADTFSSYDQAAEAAVAKAKQMIDQVGDGIFSR